MAAAAFLGVGTLTRTLLCWYNYGKNTAKGRQKDGKRTAKAATIIERLSNAYRTLTKASCIAMWCTWRFIKDP